MPRPRVLLAVAAILSALVLVAAVMTDGVDQPAGTDGPLEPAPARDAHGGDQDEHRGGVEAGCLGFGRCR